MPAKFQRLRFPVVLFCLSTMPGLLMLYYLVDGNMFWFCTGALTFGLLLGILVQLCFRQVLPKLRIAFGAFLGAFILFLPVVFVTYGLALLAFPVFFVYSGVVVLGAYLTVRLR